MGARGQPSHFDYLHPVSKIKVVKDPDDVPFDCSSQTPTRCTRCVCVVSSPISPAFFLQFSREETGVRERGCGCSYSGRSGPEQCTAWCEHRGPVPAFLFIG